MGDLRLVRIKEGRLLLEVPDIAFYSRGPRPEPAWAPVFYNPRMKLSRDISIALVEAYAKFSGRSDLSVCEPLSATGVRGLRYVAEVEQVGEVVLNDKNALAYRLELRNTSLNGLEQRVKVYNRDVRALLYELAEEGVRFDVVDIDPFGTPAPFVEAAVSTLKHGGMLCVTATDLAPLFGVHPSACLRKYSAVPLNSEFSKEVGARILASFVIREAAKLNLAAVPLYTFLALHSLRIAFLVYKSKSKARKLVEGLGFLVYCRQCLYRSFAGGLRCVSRSCPFCGLEDHVAVSGPLWVGDLWNTEFTKIVRECYESRSYLDRRGLKLTKLVEEEADKPPLYTTVSAFAKLAKIPDEPSPRSIVERVRAMGGRASLTHFESKGFRSSLQPKELLEALRECF